MRWLLYSRKDCPLCDYAANILQASGVGFAVADIDQDEILRQKYDLRVPVIINTETGAELGFPFEPQDVQAFLDQA